MFFILPMHFHSKIFLSSNINLPCFNSFIYLFIFGCAGSSLLCELFSSWGKQGPPSTCFPVAASTMWSRDSRQGGSNSCGHGRSYSAARGIPWTRDGIHASSWQALKCFIFPTSTSFYYWIRTAVYYCKEGYFHINEPLLGRCWSRPMYLNISKKTEMNCHSD